MLPTYAAVRLKVAAPILDLDNNSLTNTEYLVTILCPSVAGAGAEISLPTKLTKKLQLNQEWKLRLLVSNNTIPSSKYIVTYADAAAPKKILSRERWVVPANFKPKRTVIDLVPGTLVYDLPTDFDSLISLRLVNLVSTYEIVNNQLVITNVTNSAIADLSYSSYLTRADLLYLPTTWKRNQNQSALTIAGLTAPTEFDYLIRF
jgi:hypothetical protein